MFFSRKHFSMLKTESEYIRLSHYVSELKDKLQHAHQELWMIRAWISLLYDAEQELLVVKEWEMQAGAQERKIALLNTQLCEYESLVDR